MQRLIEVFGAEAQSFQRALDHMLCLEAAGMLEARMQIAISLHPRFPLGMLRVAHQLLELAQLRLHRMQMAEGTLRGFDQRTTFVEVGLLSQVGDPQSARLTGRPLGRFFDARDDLEQRRLAGAVRADERDLVAAVGEEADTLEDALGAIPFAYVMTGQDSHLE